MPTLQKKSEPTKAHPATSSEIFPTVYALDSQMETLEMITNDLEAALGPILHRDEQLGQAANVSTAVPPAAKHSELGNRLQALLDRGEGVAQRLIRLLETQAL